MFETPWEHDIGAILQGGQCLGKRSLLLPELGDPAPFAPQERQFVGFMLLAPGSEEFELLVPLIRPAFGQSEKGVTVGRNPEARRRWSP